MYEDLVKQIRTIAKLYETVGLDGLVITQLMNQAADSIEELSKRASEWETIAESWQKACEGLESRIPRWIPVTERLPEKRKWVLCRCEANIIEVLRWENNEWYHDPMHVYYPSFVTHWMPLPPLPDPPKEET